jgi:16S rRNA (cytosine967-C5)-methyltransferase
MSGVKPGERVADICAGAGGKTLALAAMMAGEGELIAHDKDRHRLRPIFERLMRAGAGFVKVEEPQGLFDCVVIDAPCSGSGAWRRKPDSKWKLTRQLLDQRKADQREVLQRGAALVKPGGRLVYITCSVLAEENSAQVEAFLAGAQDFSIVPFAEQWRLHIGGNMPVSADGSGQSLLLTPARHDTDGFFVAVLAKKVT